MYNRIKMFLHKNGKKIASYFFTLVCGVILAYCINRIIEYLLPAATIKYIKSNSYLIFLVLSVITRYASAKKRQRTTCGNCGTRNGPMEVRMKYDPELEEDIPVYLCPQCRENFDIRAGKKPPKRSIFLDY